MSLHRRTCFREEGPKICEPIKLPLRRRADGKRIPRTRNLATTAATHYSSHTWLGVLKARTRSEINNNESVELLSYPYGTYRIQQRLAHLRQASRLLAV